MVMGVVNVTPDSFSDGGRYLDPLRAVEHGVELVREGADLLDVGGESTRPGALDVSEEEELRRVVPVVRELAAAVDVPISVDTRKARVAEAVIEAGASMINDVSAGRDDPGLLAVVADSGAALVVMHMRGRPATMQINPEYDDVVAQVEEFLIDRAAAAVQAGVRPGSLVLDPGIGFGKTDVHNLALLRATTRLASWGHPLLVGPSRKGMIGRVLGTPVHERAEGTAAIAAWVVERGARMVRAHDVQVVARTVRMIEALLNGSLEP